MGLVLGIGVVALLIWLFRPRGRPQPAPEDDLTTPIDRDALEQAERELRADPRPRTLDEADEADDWGPGAG